MVKEVNNLASIATLKTYLVGDSGRPFGLPLQIASLDEI